MQEAEIKYQNWADSLPHVRAIWSDGERWKIICPYCNQIHIHRALEGARAPHCAPESGVEYVILPPDDSYKTASKFGFYEVQIMRLRNRMLDRQDKYQKCICRCRTSVLLKGGFEIWRNGRKVEIGKEQEGCRYLSELAIGHFDFCPICGRDIRAPGDEDYELGYVRI